MNELILNNQVVLFYSIILWSLFLFWIIHILLKKIKEQKITIDNFTKKTSEKVENERKE